MITTDSYVFWSGKWITVGNRNVQKMIRYSELYGMNPEKLERLAKMGYIPSEVGERARRASASILIIDDLSLPTPASDDQVDVIAWYTSTIGRLK